LERSPVRAAALRRRRTRQLVVVAVLLATLAAFLTLPLPPLRFEGSGYMADAADNINDRAKFERRFPIAVGPTTGFHSYLGDLVMTRLERAYAASGNSGNATRVRTQPCRSLRERCFSSNSSSLRRCIDIHAECAAMLPWRSLRLSPCCISAITSSAISR
jgi:hypothetical protein